MRWNELFENVARYLPMYNAIKNPPKTYRGSSSMIPVPEMIRRVEQMLKRQDRIIWFLRWHRLYYAYQVNDSMYNEATGDIDEDYEEYGVPESVMKKYMIAVGLSPETPRSKTVEMAYDVIQQLDTYKHYVDMNIASMEAVVWDRQSPLELGQQMEKLEDEWQSRLDSAVRERKGEDEKIIDFGNGWAWFNLHRGHCRDEANAMGHCGNAGSAHGDEIYSLRKHVEEGYWEPHLTFIRRSDGTLGEMKGRGNEKPREKYHSMIIALLRHEHIEGVTGGGYLPGNNFSLDDLDPEEKEALLNEKPTLRSVHEIYAEWNEQLDKVGYDNIDPALNEVFETKFEALLSQWRHKKIDYREGIIIVDKTPIALVYTPLVEAAQSTFDDLADYIQTYAGYIEDIDPDVLADRVQADHEDKIYTDAVQGSTYRLSCWDEYDSESRMVTVKLSISELLSADDDELNNLQSLDETYDGGDDDYDWIDSPKDEVGEALWEYIIDYAKDKDKAKADKRTLVMTILTAYGIGAETDWSRDGSPTMPHPDQYEFDFPKKS